MTVKDKVAKWCKRALCVLLATLLLLSATYVMIPTVWAANELRGSSGTLNTAQALGSPILNDNFTIEQWNKWEMIAWGLFLSNFCVPLVDTYNTAFHTGQGGSNGTGYAALVFGSGSDSQTSSVVQDLCDYACAIQTGQLKDIYVAYADIDQGSIVSGPDMDIFQLSGEYNEDATIREATVSDLFFNVHGEGEDKTTWVNKTTISAPPGDAGYDTLYVANEGQVPIFYIQNGTSFIKILDYTNSWDVQLMSLIVNSASSARGDVADKFIENLVNLVTDDGAYLKLDPFGNITLADGTMVFPGACNQNLTQTSQINVLNSWIINGYTSPVKKNDLINRVSQLKQNQGTAAFTGLFNENYEGYGGLPAIQDNALADNVALMYYDMDKLLLNKWYKEGTYNAAYGDNVLELFQKSIAEDSPGLKIEQSGILKGTTTAGFLLSKSNSDADDIIARNMVAANLVANIADDSSVDILDTIYQPDGDAIPLFDDPVVIPVMVETAETTQGNKVASAAARKLPEFLYEIYTGKIKDLPEYGEVSKNTAIAALSGHGLGDVNAYALGDSTSSLVRPFWTWAGLDLVEANERQQLHLNPTTWVNPFNYLIMDDNAFSNDKGRLILAYPPSEIMSQAAQVLGMVDGTEFSVLSSMIYATYLEFYGVLNTSTVAAGVQRTSNFDTRIFDESSEALSVDPGAITTVKSEDQMENEVLQMGYLMLHPTEGRDYRKQIILSTLSDWIYNQYIATVYGSNDLDYYTTATKGNSPFLYVDSYAENFLTGWFLTYYTSIAVWILMICVVLIIIIGLLHHRSISWYFFSLLILINAILLVPSSGDIIPAVTGNIVNSMFENKMTYWAISEAVTNAKMEQDAISKQERADMGDDVATLVSLVKQLNVVYTDRSLMVKRDISAKVNPELAGVYTEIQQLQSARWMLPMIMRQFSAREESNMNAYVYGTLADLEDDLSNCYYYFVPTAAQYDKTAAAVSDAENVRADLGGLHDSLISSYADYVKFGSGESGVVYDDSSSDIKYMSTSYDARTQPIHTFYFALPKTVTIPSRKIIFGDKNAEYKEINDMAKFTESAITYAAYPDTWDVHKNGLFDASESYDREDRSTINEWYPYLWTTEDVAYYFYMVVRDTFSDSKSLGYIIGQIQGQYGLDANGKEVRDSFMHALDGTGEDARPTGYVKDVGDLQCLLANVVPYLYEVQLAAGGFDGESGILTETDENGETVAMTIGSGSNYYNANMAQSWYYRSNWATKLMENPMYSEPVTVTDHDGNKYDVTYPILFESYPDNRRMVCSEAQMHALGLTEANLSLVENKCVAVNKEIVRRWTLLLNYASTSGMTREVLYRQMALEAAFAFNTEFSSSAGLNNTYQLYPKGLDLRNLSFDSVMKMLMLNVSKDTSYIYGNTMQTLIETTDIFTAILLLVTAWICSFIIPLIRNALMALIFYLGFVAIIRAMFSDGTYKLKICCGQVVCNIAFLASTVVYYAVFAGILSITSSDSVLTVDSVAIKPGNPVWLLIVVLAVSVAYTYFMCKMIKFCFMHFKDMGYEAISMMVHGIGDAFHGALDKFSGKITGNRDATPKKHVSDADHKSEKEKEALKQGNGSSSSGKSSTVEAAAGTTVVTERADKDRETASAKNDKLDESASAKNAKEEHQRSNVNIDAQIDKGAKIAENEKKNDNK